MNKEEWLKKGYVTEPVDKTLDLKTEIDKLRKEKNALILGHYYQSGEIQDIADFVGDSLALAQWAAKTDADIIVMCGVHFMGETAKILCPDKKVLVPDLNAGCSLADSCPADEFAKFVQEHPDYTVISYVNTTAAVKAVTDVVVTSTKDFIVATESGILHEMRKKCPEKNFIPAPPEDSTCACNECNFMRLNTLEKLYNTLKYEWPEVTVDEAVAEEAVKPIKKMLEISEKLGL